MSIPYRQDMPPPGGFETVKYKRNMSMRGPSGFVFFAGLCLVTGYGFYRVGKGNNEKRELQREKVWSRIHLVPLLMAESDRHLHGLREASVAREKEIMKNVKGWEAGKSVYSNTRYQTPDLPLL
ncbi:B16.6 subunit of GRIM-19, NADH:ubiquinone oxidoreductase [Mycena floridula]|nr:B16.6 subunit of GRIM-19, NADH:ubiquinone oxidoreductase [Mycena floridula]